MYVHLYFKGSDIMKLSKIFFLTRDYECVGFKIYTFTSYVFKRKTLHNYKITTVFMTDVLLVQNSSYSY